MPITPAVFLIQHKKMSKEVGDIMKYEVIDAHVHPFLPEIGRNIGKFGIPATTAEFVEELRSNGVSRCCGSIICQAEKMDFQDIEDLNRAALKMRDMYPDFYIPGIHVHGDYPEESIAMLKAFHGDGVRWIGEMVNYSMPIGRYNSPGMKKIAETAAALGMVMNLHVSTGDLPEVDDLMKSVPELKVVLAHPGDGADLDKRFEFIKAHGNLYIDISGTGLFRWGMLRHAVDMLGVEKIIYGSDFPVCSSGMNLYGTLSEHLTEDEFSAVLAGNFKELIGA